MVDVRIPSEPDFEEVPVGTPNEGSPRAYGAKLRRAAAAVAAATSSRSGASQTPPACAQPQKPRTPVHEVEQPCAATSRSPRWGATSETSNSAHQNSFAYSASDDEDGDDEDDPLDGVDAPAAASKSTTNFHHQFLHSHDDIDVTGSSDVADADSAHLHSESMPPWTPPTPCTPSDATASSFGKAAQFQSENAADGATSASARRLTREEQLEQQLRQKDQQLKEALERNAQLQNENPSPYRSGSSEREEALEGELKRVQARLEELEAGRRSARSALAEMASQNARLVSAYAAKKEEVRGVRVELQRVQSASSEKVDALENKLKRSQEEVASLKESLQRERDRNARRQNAPEEERERFSNERARWEAERAKLEAENHALRDQLDALRAQHNGSTTPPNSSSAHRHRRSASTSAYGGSSERSSYNHARASQQWRKARDRDKERERDREQRERETDGAAGYAASASAFGPSVNGRGVFTNTGSSRSAERRHSWSDGYPDSSAAAFNFAQAQPQHNQEQHDEQQQSSKEPQSDAEWNKQEGNALFHSQRFEEAIEQYTAGMAKDGASGSVKAALHCNRAAAYQAQRMFIPAIADCFAALDIDSQYMRALQRRADAFFSIGDYASAARDMESIGASSLGADGVARYEDAKRKSKRNLPVDYYAVLGVSSAASGAEVKGRYRQLALRHHPDKASELSESMKNAAESLFKLINEAYATLSDPAAKRKYDAQMLSSKLRRQHSVP